MTRCIIGAILIEQLFDKCEVFCLDRVILHSDCNNFYASVECMLNPQLQGKFVAVGGNEEERHGIILAKNEAAKRMGVRTGETLWLAKQKCPELIIVPPHYEKYIGISAATREIYHDNTNQVEPFGLDEAWLDVTGEDGLTAAKRISDRIKKELGITVSIGVSFNKVFAKLGSDYKKPDAITVISRENFRTIAWGLPASDLLYVGRATGERLDRMGVRTIGDIARLPLEVMHNRFGKTGDMLHRFANGEDNSPVALFGEVPPVKSVGNSITTVRDLVCREDMLRVMTVLCQSVAMRLRAGGIRGRRVSVYMRTNELVHCSRQTTLADYTNREKDILSAVMEIVDSEHDWRIPLRSVGVSVSKLTTENAEQTTLFYDPYKREREDRLTAEVDRLKLKYGKAIIVPATVLADPELTAFEYGTRFNPFGIRSGQSMDATDPDFSQKTI